MDVERHERRLVVKETYRAMRRDRQLPLSMSFNEFWRHQNDPTHEARFKKQFTSGQRYKAAVIKAADAKGGT